MQDEQIALVRDVAHQTRLNSDLLVVLSEGNVEASSMHEPIKWTISNALELSHECVSRLREVQLLGSDEFLDGVRLVVGLGVLLGERRPLLH